MSSENYGTRRIQWDERTKVRGLVPIAEQWGIGQRIPGLPSRGEQARLEATFTRLVRDWRRETQNLSSLQEIVIHPAYQRIIGLGRPVLPLILRELRAEPDHWHWALEAITGEDPVAPEHSGDLEAIANDWLRWAKDRLEVGC